MLASEKMTGFVVTKDYDAARAFYVGKLGFEFVSLDQFALVVKAGESHIRIGKIGDFTPRQGTVLGWDVERHPRGCEVARQPRRGARKIPVRPG